MKDIFMMYFTIKHDKILKSIIALRETVENALKSIEKRKIMIKNILNIIRGENGEFWIYKTIQRIAAGYLHTVFRKNNCGYGGVCVSIFNTFYVKQAWI